MSNSRKKLDAAIAKTKVLPADWFGNIEASVDELPSVQKSKRVRKNIFIDQATVEALEYICKEKDVAFTELSNDILTSFVNQKRKKSS